MLEPPVPVWARTFSTRRLARGSSGIAESTWVIPRDAKTGDYDIRVQFADETWLFGASFRVEEFRVPTMAADLQGPEAPVVGGDPFTLDLYVSYLSGGGAGGLEVKLRTLVEERRLSYPAYEQFRFGGEEIEEGTEPYDDYGWYEETGGNATPGVTPLTLDDEGAARVEIKDYRALPMPSRLVAELEYQDANGEVLTSARSFNLWPAGVTVGIKTDGWAASEDDLSFQVLVLDPSGRPVADKAVTAALFTRKILSYRKRLVGGFYSYESLKQINRVEGTCAGETNAQGILICELEPQVSGEVLIRASALDDAGNESFATESIWLVGEDDWWFAAADSDRMDLLPEQPEYEAGDTARFQVRMPFREATALVTVLREGVLDSYVMELDGGEPVIEVPVKDSYAPNVYVSVLAVRGRVGSIRSELAALARDWDLPWLSRDGGPATGTVDLSKPAYRLGMAEIKVGWAPHRLNVEVSADAETYGVREAAEVAIKVTPALGGDLPAGAEVAIAVVDEALLQLRSNRTWDLLTPMMDERGIEVYTSTAQMQVIGKRHYGRKALPEGGGGGRLDSRELFDTLLLWEGRVILDQNGETSVTVPLNDSLTAFRIVAVASAGLNLFGTGSATINTSQDLMLFSGLPPVVREADRFDAGFTLHDRHARGTAGSEFCPGDHPGRRRGA